jgi:hypothetical protein
MKVSWDIFGMEMESLPSSNFRGDKGFRIRVLQRTKTLIVERLWTNAFYFLNFT